MKKIEDRPMILGFRNSKPQATDCGSQRISVEDGKIIVRNLTTEREDSSCSYSAATMVISDPQLQKLTGAFCKETGTIEFTLPKGEVRTICFQGTIDKKDQEEVGFRTFKGEFEILGV